VFAQESGSIAAPTAGLHFTDAILRSLDDAGVERTTSHAARRLRHVQARARDGRGGAHGRSGALLDSRRRGGARQRARSDAGRRVIVVGTTTTRALESAAERGGGRVVADAAETSLFIHPGHRSSWPADSSRTFICRPRHC